VVGLHDVLLRPRDDEIDDHRGAARKPRRGACLEILARDGSHERQLHVRVRIDAARHDVLAAGVDDGCARRRVQAFAHCGDQTVLAQHVGTQRLVGVDDGAAFDQYCHVELLASPRATM
jgi:hypothetical protein